VRIYQPHQRAGFGPTLCQPLLAGFTIFFVAALLDAAFAKSEGNEAAGLSVIALERKTTVNGNRHACTARIGGSLFLLCLGRKRPAKTRVGRRGNLREGVS
jgi:hypothetical protein